MTPIFVCGAEAGATVATPGHWDTLVGTGVPTIETTIIAPGGGAASFKWVSNAAQAYLAHTLAQTTVAARFYFYFGVLPTGLTATIANFVNANGSGNVRVGTGGQVAVTIGTNSANIGSPVSAGAWHYVDVKVDCSGTTAYIYGKLDSGTEASTSIAQTSANITSFRQGWSTAPTTGTLYIDHIMLSAMADYPIGPGAVLGYRPTKDGTHTATSTHIVKGTTATPVGAAITSATTDAYQWADAATISTTGTFINQQTILATEYVELGFGIIALVPQAVEVLVALSAGSTAADTQKSVLWDGVTAVDMYALATIGVAHPTLQYKRAIYAASMSGAWTAALFNALKFRWGYSTDATPNAYLDNVVLEVAIGPAPTLQTRRSSAWVAGVVRVRRGGAWVSPTQVKVRRSGGWS
jgi:hypothetical protein